MRRLPELEGFAREARLVDLDTGRARWLTKGVRARAPDVSADGRTVVFVRRLGDRSELAAIAISPDGKTLASAGRSQSIRLWETATGKEAGVRRDGHSGGIVGLAFTPDGKTLASGSHDTTILLWDLTTIEKK